MFHTSHPMDNMRGRNGNNSNNNSGEDFPTAVTSFGNNFGLTSLQTFGNENNNGCDCPNVNVNPITNQINNYYCENIQSGLWNDLSGTMSPLQIIMMQPQIQNETPTITSSSSSSLELNSASNSATVELSSLPPQPPPSPSLLLDSSLFPETIQNDVSVLDHDVPEGAALTNLFDDDSSERSKIKNDNCSENSNTLPTDLLQNNSVVASSPVISLPPVTGEFFIRAQQICCLREHLQTLRQQDESLPLPFAQAPNDCTTTTPTGNASSLSQGLGIIMDDAEDVDGDDDFDGSNDSNDAFNGTDTNSNTDMNQGNTVCNGSNGLVPLQNNKVSNMVADLPNHRALSQQDILSHDPWWIRFGELQQFKENFGHCIVPHNYKPNIPLAQWVKRQRHQRKRKHRKEHSTLTAIREQALDSLNFVWDAHSVSWEIRWYELVEFMEIHGHCNVPSTFPENPQLSVWVKSQRRLFRTWKKKKDKKDPDQIAHQRFTRLASIGFDFNPRNI